MFIEGLGFIHAQKIVDNLMTIVPFSISIMDKSGTIIAGGESERIGKRSYGAVKALALKEAFYLQEVSVKERKGINVPVRYKDEIVAVIGVSGEREDVETIANVLRVTAELMIEKQFYDHRMNAKRCQISDFFNELLIRPGLQRNPEVAARAKELGVDLSLPRIAVIVKIRENKPELADFIADRLDEGEYVVHGNAPDVVVLLRDGDDADARLEALLASHPDLDRAFVGFATSDVFQSHDAATAVMNVIGVLGVSERISRFRSYILEDFAVRLQPNDFVDHVRSLFARTAKSDALRETLIAYVLAGMDITATCERLSIHKNTFYYRMHRLSEVTGFEMRDVNSMIVLYLYMINA